MGSLLTCENPQDFLARKPWMMPLFFRAVFFLGFAGLVGCAAPAGKAPLRTVPHVDLQRYSGEWRVIANIPYFAERGCVDSADTYVLRDDGNIDNIFSYRKPSFESPVRQMKALAKVVDRKTNAHWKVTFFGFFSFPYYVVALDPDYQWAAIAHPSRRYGWILARSRSLPDATYEAILERLEKMGYAREQFVKVPQEK